MIQIKRSEQRKSKYLYDSYHKNYIQYLKSLIPPQYLQQQNNSNLSTSIFNDNLNTLDFFNSKTINTNKSNSSLYKSRIKNLQTKKNTSVLGQFLLKLVKTIAQQKYIDQYGQLENITKQLGIDIKQLNKIDNAQIKIQFMMNSIDKQIEDQKKKLLFNPKCQANSSILTTNQKPCSFAISLNNLAVKQNNFIQNNEFIQKIPSKYQSFIRQQNKKQVDNFAWLQIKTKYPMLQKKLKSKLIQSINQDKNQKRIRDLIEKKQNIKKLNNNSSFSNSNYAQNPSIVFNPSIIKQNSSATHQGQYPDIQDEKIDLVNESLFMQEFQKAKIDYIWTDNDQKMFLKNIKQLRNKCSNNSEFLKLCGRFKFISQKQFQTLASEDISRMLNKNNKIYLSREFLLDKYYSTTQILTQQQMRFILKTSPMLSKCVDRNFIKTAIKNIRYENISDLQLKIAEDIIGRFQKLRNSVRASRKAYKQQINQVAKQRIAYFQKNKELQIAKQLAHQELKNHKIHLMRALNYQKKNPSSTNIINSGLSKKMTKNIWTPLNKYHPSTGLFVKDCNQQCTDDIFNPYEKQYLKKIESSKQPPKKNIITKSEMIKFYTGGPDQCIAINFNANGKDINSICSIIKAYFFEKKILAALQSIEISQPIIQSTRRDESKSCSNQIKTKKTLALSPDEQFQMMAKRKLLQNRQKAKQTVYVNKLLFLAAQNSYLSLKALNPQFNSEQVNTRDKKGNTALYYAAKFANQDFVQYLMKFGANPNMKCQKQMSPLHLGFKSNNMTLILKLFTSSSYPPNLNLLNNENKTPLAYCSRQVLKRLNLEEGIASVDANSVTLKFDNNNLLQREQYDKIKQEPLQVQGQFLKRINQNKAIRKMNSTLTSLQNMNVQ